MIIYTVFVNFAPFYSFFIVEKEEEEEEEEEEEGKHRFDFKNFAENFAPKNIYLEFR